MNPFQGSCRKRAALLEKPGGTFNGRRPLLTLLLTPVLFQTQKVKCLPWKTSLEIVYTAAVGLNLITEGTAGTM